MAVLRSAGPPEGRERTTIREITVLSNRADLISGGDALVAIDLGNTDASAVKVTLNGNDITNAFAVRENGRVRGTGHRSQGGQERARCAPGTEPTPRQEQARERDRDRPTDHDPQPSDRGTGPRRPAGHAVLLQPERLEPAARRRDRRAVQRADQGRVPLSQRRTPTSSSRTTRRTRRRRRRSSRRRQTPARRCRSSSSASPGLRIAASTRWRCSSTRASRSSRGRPRSRGATSSSTRSAARAGTDTHQRAPGQRPPGDAARARLRGRDLEPEHLRQQLQRPRLGRGDDDDQGDRRRAVRPAPVHDGQRRFGGVDAAASPRRELPGAARRADDEPGLPRPHGSGARIARLPSPLPLLLADEPAHASGTRGSAAERVVPDAALAAAGVRQQPHEPGQPLRSEDPLVRRRPDRAPARLRSRLRAARRAASGAQPIRPGSAAGRSTSCAPSSASRSRPTHRTGREGARPTTLASSTG